MSRVAASRFKDARGVIYKRQYSPTEPSLGVRREQATLFQYPHHDCACSHARESLLTEVKAVGGYFDCMRVSTHLGWKGGRISLSLSIAHLSPSAACEEPAEAFNVVRAIRVTYFVSFGGLRRRGRRPRRADRRRSGRTSWTIPIAQPHGTIMGRIPGGGHLLRGRWCAAGSASGSCRERCPRCSQAAAGPVVIRGLRRPPLRRAPSARANEQVARARAMPARR